ncbi:hypothetical protein ACJ72_06567 [Emergomyces africanus]|uniref:Glycosyltransferase 2-like domain-containing protein n=1 Tax=Emergomyces africanus TaxID=1955775 RepID=A0A1B7NQK8_9EURO|nr:hypothetical protein ACJ72_06567 [Emergomyces africanus]
MQYSTYFWCLFLHRYLRLLVNCIPVLLYKPIPPPKNPSFTSSDVTVIVPTLKGHGKQLVETLYTICRAEPHQIILSTIEKNREKAEQTANWIQESFQIKVKVKSIQNPDKQRQTAVAIDEVNVVETAIIVLADDDVRWGLESFPLFLAPFEDPKRGGVATCQRLLRTNAGFFQQIFEFLGALYLERRNFDCTATMFMDGGVPCLSGRTLVLRTEIVKDEAFHKY